MGKTACLISCSDHYGHRLYVADQCLKEEGFDTFYLTSDFDHYTKTKFECNVEGAVQLPAKPYKKNLSISRILSHRAFAKDAFKYLDSLEKCPDIVIALIPPNFLVHYGAKFKKKHPETKLVFDVFDMWPETFPGGKIKKLLAPAFKIWAYVRDKSINAADYIICECGMFKELLRLPNDKSKTVYLCAAPLDFEKSLPSLSEDKIELCYIGAINNIISIPDICGLISEIAKTKPVTLHIIGKGEREQEFIESATAAGANVIFYGSIYDDKKKNEIMSRCHFGLNIMKSSVCVGLTMKSIEYFRHGLPIINNIPCDTYNIVEKENIGINLNKDTARKILELSVTDLITLRKNTENVFNTVFCFDIVKQNYNDILSNEKNL